ncbi:PAS domain-containing sensor histidine kinase [Hasllibacter sp. MH4015]|uniref:sensor histidine kinase n=1 Tax=Hasllibacter sp. MH4015 TaxID=2854029 RepID=UPI001CD799F7|nr:PAS domain-containing sensor histidine kinase [Hasllibacter sp. MH4015]
MSIMDMRRDGLALSRLTSWVDGLDLPTFMVILKEDGTLEFAHANGALGRMSGIPPEMFNGRNVSDLFPTRTAARLEKNYRQSFETGEPVSYEECLLIEERETWWQTTLSRPDGFDGRVVLGVAVPITERKEREFASAKALADLNARFDELRLFSTMAAHDARSPLATVSSLIDLVLDGFEDMGDGKAELLRLCSSTVDEALTQISATLDRGQSLNSGVELNSRVDLGRLCGDIAAMLDPEMSLSITTPDLVVICDEVVVQMAVRNLMSNAARFCRSRIAVEARIDPDRRQMILDVTDDGPGMPRGSTLRDLTKSAETRDGTHGVGLASIATLLRSRGGALDIVHSGGDQVLGGARFRVTLPAEKYTGATAGVGVDVNPIASIVNE